MQKLESESSKQEQSQPVVAKSSPSSPASSPAASPSLSPKPAATRPGLSAPASATSRPPASSGSMLSLDKPPNYQPPLAGSRPAPATAPVFKQIRKDTIQQQELAVHLFTTVVIALPY